MDVGPMRKEDVLDALQRRLFTISEVPSSRLFMFPQAMSNTNACMHMCHSQLYRDVVQPLSLLDSTLLIFHVSDHRDQTLTETVWREIVERGRLRRSSTQIWYFSPLLLTPTIQLISAIQGSFGGQRLWLVRLRSSAENFIPPTSLSIYVRTV